MACLTLSQVPPGHTPQGTCPQHWVKPIQPLCVCFSSTIVLSSWVLWLSCWLEASWLIQATQIILRLVFSTCTIFHKPRGPAIDSPFFANIIDTSVVSWNILISHLAFSFITVILYNLLHIFSLSYMTSPYIINPSPMFNSNEIMTQASTDPSI